MNETGESIVSRMSVEHRRVRQVKVVLIIVAIVLAGSFCWHNRHSMNPDGISYLDIAEAYIEGGFSEGLNGFWSPFYSWLLALGILALRPSPYWESGVAQLMNFAVFMAALVAFEFFLRGLTCLHRGRISRLSESGRAAMPEWVLVALGYGLFIWSSLQLVGVQEVTPDMGVTTIVYAASGVMLRIRSGSRKWLLFVFLGVILGMGYLVKSPLLPMACVFLLVALFAGGSVQKTLPRVILAALVAGCIAGPYVASLSKKHGRLTAGEGARLNYIWHVINHLPQQGTLKHPPKVLLDSPQVRHFTPSTGGTYPIRYDQAYWYDGLESPFYPTAFLRVMTENLGLYVKFFLNLQSAMIVGFLIVLMYTISDRGIRASATGLAHYWVLLVPVVAAFAMYSLVHIENRYFGSFVTLLWLGLFAGIHLKEDGFSRRMLTFVGLGVTVFLLMSVAAHTIPKARGIVRDVLFPNSSRTNKHWNIAQSLHSMGIEPGDNIACLGGGLDAYWARLLDVTIIADVSPAEVGCFWAADVEVRSRVFQVLRDAGAKGLIARGVPSCENASARWQAIGNTRYSVYWLGKEDIAE